MGPFRVLQISIVILMLFGSTWLVRTAGLSPSSAGPSTSWMGGAEALADVLQQGDNGDNNGGDNNAGDNNDGDNNGGDNNDGDNNGGDNNGGDNNGGDNNGGDNNDNGSDDNDNFDDFDLPPLPPLPSSSRPERAPDPVCTTPGQEAVFTSHDDKVTLRIFANTPRPVRVEIYQVIDFLSAPLPPGNLVGLLAYEIRASYCDANPLEELPAEANLGIRYSDLEATGLDKSRFVIGRLDLATGTWTPVEKLGNDPSSNYTSATIIQTGFYMVWEAR